MDKAVLPPMPDRQTGEPRPPKAPTSGVRGGKPAPWSPKKVPVPPECEGAILEWEYDTHTTRLGSSVIAGLVVAVFATIVDRGFGWVDDWSAWVIIGSLVLFMLLAVRNRLSAGADWFMHRNDLVKTYELISINFEKDFYKGELDLRDKYGGRVHVGIGDIARNSALWDLVYNGIRHSVVNGAEVNSLAVKRLELDDVLAIRDSPHT